jgi:hypothetical protein
VHQAIVLRGSMDVRALRDPSELLGWRIGSLTPSSCSVELAADQAEGELSDARNDRNRWKRTCASCAAPLVVRRGGSPGR